MASPQFCRGSTRFFALPLVLVTLLSGAARAQSDSGSLFDAVGDDAQAAEVDAQAQADAEAEKYKAEVEAAAAKARAEADAKAEEDKKAEEAAKAKAVATTADATPPASHDADISAHPWNGSSFMFQNALQAVSLDKGALPTWNPNDSNTLIFRPVYNFNKTFSAALRLMVMQELTNADDTTYYHETVLADAWLDLNGRFKESNTGISILANLRTTIPFSKSARLARTLYTALSPGITLSRGFEVLDGLSVRYLARGTFNFNKYTTTQFEGSTLVDCPIDRVACGQFAHSGVRNASRSWATGPGATISFLKDFSFSSDFNLMRADLYDLNDVAPGLISYQRDADVPNRYIAYFLMDLGWQATPSIALDLGLWTWGGQLGPDGLYRNPFFNIDTTLYFSASYEIGNGLGAFF